MTCVKQALSDLAEEHDLTLQQALVMHTLNDGGVMFMGAVADKMHCDASNITGIIDRLVQQGYVVRQEDPQDRRAKQLILTAKGSSFVQEVISKVPVAIGFDRLTDADRGELYGYLTKLGV